MHDAAFIVNLDLLVLLWAHLFLDFDLINEGIVVLIETFVTCIDSAIFYLYLALSSILR